MGDYNPDTNKQTAKPEPEAVAEAPVVVAVEEEPKKKATKKKAK